MTLAAKWTVFVLGSLSLLAKAAGEVRLNEFAASRDAGIADTNGDLVDWVEIVNTADEPVNLAGWMLTDARDDLEKWTFPSLSLPAKGFVVLLANGKDGVDEDGHLQMGFKLDADGEYLALLNPEGEVVDALDPAFPAQSGAASYGRDVEGEWRFWPVPTPGAENRDAPSSGPLLLDPWLPLEPIPDGEDLVLTVRAQATYHPIASLSTEFQVMYRTASTVTMSDDGVGPDVLANDGVYTVKISARSLFGARYKAGDMLRWSFTTRDDAGQTTRLPATDGRSFGGVVDDPSLESTLPVLHTFVEDEARYKTAAGSRASVYFEGQFYDGIFVRRRGQFGAIEWPKPKLKFDFNPGEHFRYRADRRRVEEFNMHPHFTDASYMRENLAFKFFNDMGTPAPDTMHWQMRLNGAYFGLYSLVEQVDADFLEQQGLDPEGAMYKANGFPSTLALGVTSALYQKETRRDEPYDDLIDFVAGINSATRGRYIKDHVNIPAMINEMACQVVIGNLDRLTKNYYMYEAPRTGLWQRFPWDMDGAYRGGSSINDENFRSPLYGDSEHTQAPNQKIYQNFLLDAILDDSTTREMYFRRLRTLIDDYLAPEATYFADAMTAFRARIEEETRRDNEKWRIGTIQAGMNDIVNQYLRPRYQLLTETYGSSGEGLVPDPQTPGLKVRIRSVEARPENPLAEYVELENPNKEAIDLSGWSLRGAVNYILPPGTVIAARGTILQPNRQRLYITRDVKAFLAREAMPSGNRDLAIVGNYPGQLEARGGLLELLDGMGNIVDEINYESRASQAQDFLRVSQVHYHPEEPTSSEAVLGWEAEDFELIALVNTGSEPLPLAGVRFVSGVSFAFPSQSILAPGVLIWLGRNADAAQARYGVALAGVYDGVLSNGGERLRLEDADGEVILDFRYDDEWQASTDGLGQALQAVDLVAEPTRWEEASFWLGGAPGSNEGRSFAELAFPQGGHVTLSRAATGEIELRCEGSANVSYSVEGTQDLRAWETIAEAPVADVFMENDRRSLLFRSSDDWLFFRVRALPTP